jgi:hypothetical protein
MAAQKLNRRLLTCSRFLARLVKNDVVPVRPAAPQHTNPPFLIHSPFHRGESNRVHLFVCRSLV